MSLDPTNMGVGEVKVTQAFSVADLSMDSAAMGAPPQLPFFNANPDPPAGLPLPPTELTAPFTSV